MAIKKEEKKEEKKAVQIEVPKPEEALQIAPVIENGLPLEEEPHEDEPQQVITDIMKECEEFEI